VLVVARTRGVDCTGVVAPLAELVETPDVDVEGDVTRCEVHPTTTNVTTISWRARITRPNV
jgi:hypothetical protein